ncbi:hypothetical protein KCMC57_64160 (plasmid) [Kitasatospora sp. CMC57]|uniref:Uncharacterized protein n=2 Tax=Kitasatospora sp. CMC57 TaxID=3231513 RepID=A0AB33K8Q8_9ACTN
MRPSALPRMRDQLLQHLTDPTAPLRADTGTDNQPGLDAEASRLRAAELFWVAPDMTALAVAAGDQLAAARWASADRPSPSGLIVFDGGIGSFDSGGVQIPVEAISWGAEDGALGIGLYLSRTRLAAEISQLGTLEEDAVPPLVPLRSHTLPITPEPVAFADLDPGIPTMVATTLAAAWALMQQVTLVDRRPAPADKSTARAYARRQQPLPGVTIVDLRRAYVPDYREEEGADPAGRRYRHRWVVTGHWRDQAHGPDRALRRRQWIPAYVKGPDGAPLLATEKVNVWRR